MSDRDPGQEGEHEVELLLNRKEIRGVLHYLVRWRGHTSADDEWLLAEELAHCPDRDSERVTEYDAAAPRCRRAHGNAGVSAVPAGGVAATAPAGSRFRLATTVTPAARAESRCWLVLLWWSR